VLRGKFRAGGKSLGLSSVTHIPSGVVLDRSMGLFSHYRLFTSGKRYGGGAWDMPSSASLRADGTVEMTLTNAPDRPFALHAIEPKHAAYRSSVSRLTCLLVSTIGIGRATPGGWFFRL
jgi:hypothetical protein